MDRQTQELVREHHEHEEHWLSVSDMMAGLMMLFLLISIVYMIQVENDANTIKGIAQYYVKLKVDLHHDLEQEFAPDLKRWGAEIDQDLSIRFNDPDTLFDQGSNELKPQFKQILDDFFPRYRKIITAKGYIDDVSEVRIEGHTSSLWSRRSSADEAYIHNMELSQARTRTTLEYVLGLNSVRGVKEWLKKHVTANGLSSSHTVVDARGVENYAQSRRVEFRVVTDAESRIAKILNSIE